jgi:hypothetical protein
MIVALMGDYLVRAETRNRKEGHASLHGASLDPGDVTACAGASLRRESVHVTINRPDDHG